LELSSEIAYGAYENQRIMLRDKNLIFDLDSPPPVEKWFHSGCTTATLMKTDADRMSLCSTGF